MKKLVKFAGIFLLIMITLIFVFIYTQINKPYTEIITINWSIKLPKSYKEIYSIESEANVHGDGERYHILQYENENDIDKSVKWERSKDKSIETKVNSVLSKLNIPKENMPYFQNSYQYYTEMKDKISKIYLIYFPDTKKLYVIEDLY